jgi:transposase-like protein
MSATNLFELMEDFESEKACRETLAELRWPEGVKCPRCNGDRHAYDSERYVWDCYSCGYQFSVMSGTIFHDTKLPLRKWFMAVLLMVEARKGISANQMKRTLGVSYKTAWYLCHRIRAAMKDDSAPLLSGVKEADETELMRGQAHTNSVEGVWSLLKRSVVGSYHQLSAKHLPAYVDEFQFRFNNRHNEYLFRDTLMKLVSAETLPYARLVESPAA